MRLKFLAPPVSLAALLLGLSYVDASPTELMTQAPSRVESPSTVACFQNNGKVTCSRQSTAVYRVYFVSSDKEAVKVREAASSLSIATN